MEVWNGIWKKILVWNGRFLLVWNGNGMDENCQYGIWKNRLLFHSIPRPDNDTWFEYLKVLEDTFESFAIWYQHFLLPDSN